jgi:serine phosphatase RsbU (regulator of sigma subunit)
MLPTRVALEMALLMLVGCVAGYIAKAQEGERRRRLANQLLLAQYQREIDISAQMQPLLVAPAWNGEAGATAPAALSAPALPLEIGAVMQPARPGYGGDYFDFIPLQEGRVALCIADVSGKSVRAQARLPLLKYALRALAPLYPQPDDLMAQLNQTLLPDLLPDFYIALCYVVLDFKNETLAWCNAGHMAPLLLAQETTSPAAKKREPVAPLAAPGPPLGVFEEAKYTSHSLPWRPGDQLLLYTDGLSDALATGTRADGRAADDGEERLHRLALEIASHPAFGQPIPGAQEIAQRLVNLATGSTLPREESTTRDDVTVVFVRHRAAQIAGALPEH